MTRLKGEVTKDIFILKITLEETDLEEKYFIISLIEKNKYEWGSSVLNMLKPDRVELQSAILAAKMAMAHKLTDQMMLVDDLIDLLVPISNTASCQMSYISILNHLFTFDVKAKIRFADKIFESDMLQEEKNYNILNILIFLQVFKSYKLPKRIINNFKKDFTDLEEDLEANKDYSYDDAADFDDRMQYLADILVYADVSWIVKKVKYPQVRESLLNRYKEEGILFYDDDYLDRTGKKDKYSKETQKILENKINENQKSKPVIHIVSYDNLKKKHDYIYILERSRVAFFVVFRGKEISGITTKDAAANYIYFLMLNKNNTIPAIHLYNQFAKIPTPLGNDNYANTSVEFLESEGLYTNNYNEDEDINNIHPYLRLKAKTRNQEYNGKVHENMLSFSKRDSPVHAEIIDIRNPSKTIICTYDHQPRLFVPLKNKKGYFLRCILPDELKQIQGFPSHFKLCGNKKDQIKQIGNAVPPPLITLIVKHLFKI